MNVERFVSLRADDWAALEALTNRAKGRGEHLAPPEVLRLGHLYRSAAADLAVAAGATPTPRARPGSNPGRPGPRTRLRQGGTPGPDPPFRDHPVLAAGPERRRCLALSGGILVGFAALGALWAAVEPVGRGRDPAAGFHAWPTPVRTASGASDPGALGLAVAIFTNNIVVSLEVLPEASPWDCSPPTSSPRTGPWSGPRRPRAQGGRLRPEIRAPDPCRRPAGAVVHRGVGLGRPADRPRPHRHPGRQTRVVKRSPSSCPSSATPCWAWRGAWSSPG